MGRVAGAAAAADSAGPQWGLTAHRHPSAAGAVRAAADVSMLAARCMSSSTALAAAGLAGGVAGSVGLQLLREQTDARWHAGGVVQRCRRANPGAGRGLKAAQPAMQVRFLPVRLAS